MFELEKAIADWRKQMLAAGIKSPVPMEELESHLREDIERLLKSGFHKQRAFEIAVQRIGSHETLQKEFSKNRNFPHGFGDNKATGINRILGALWMAQCAWFMITVASSPAVGQLFYHFPQAWAQVRFSLVCLTTFSLAGVVGSILLICGVKLGTSIIRIIALLELVDCVTQDGSFVLTIGWGVALSIFCLATLWFLRPKKVMNLVSTVV